MIVVGFDPGVGGAIAALNDAGVVGMWPMPTTPHAIRDILDELRLKDPDVRAFIELVTGYVPTNAAGNNASSSGKLMKNLGWCEAVCACLGISVVMVTPGVWQRKNCIPRGLTYPQRKRMLRDKATWLYPTVRVTLTTADAVLIAHHGLLASLAASPAHANLPERPNA